MDSQVEAAQDEFRWWREAVAAGRGVETEKGAPRLGYYRNREEAVAFYRNDIGGLVCWRSSSFPVPRQHDAIDELFGFCAPHPVSYEDFTYFQQQGRWPDQIAPVEVDENLPAHDRANAEIEAQRTAMAAYLAEVGQVDTKAKADKIGNWADAFAKIEKGAVASHKAEKEPHLEAGRAVDAAWKPVITRAGELKVWAKKQTEAFLIAERDRIRKEEAVAAEQRAKIAREAEEARRAAEAVGAPPPVAEPAQLPAPPPAKAKAGRVHLRTVTKHEIVDLRALLTYFADMNSPPADLLTTAQVIVNRMRAAGVEVPGVVTKTIEVAA